MCSRAAGGVLYIPQMIFSLSHYVARFAYVAGYDCLKMLMRWTPCMLREIILVGCSYLDIIDYR